MMLTELLTQIKVTTDCEVYPAMPGYCPIIAHSFTELVKRLYESGDNAFSFYWDEPGFVSLGDAYDGIDYQRDERDE